MPERNQPISRLDERVDDLLRALGRLPNLEQMIDAMREHEALASTIGLDYPGAVDVLAGAEFRRALIDVAGEVLVLRRTGADHGYEN